MVTALLVAAVTWFVGWGIVEVLGIIDDHRNPPSTKASGVATAIGNRAVVIKSFTAGEDGQLRGRVRFEGEDWKAVYRGDAETPPAKDDRVTILEVDTGRLEVRVE